MSSKNNVCKPRFIMTDFSKKINAICDRDRLTVNNKKIALRFGFNIISIISVYILLLFVNTNVFSSQNSLAIFLNIILASILAFFVAQLGFSGHVSGHLSPTSRLALWHNRMYDLFLGISSFAWRQQHHGSHHHLTNISYDGGLLDTDIKPLLLAERFYNPYRRKKNIKFFAVLSVIITCMLLIPLYNILDVIKIFTGNYLVSFKAKKPSPFEVIYFLIAKAVYLSLAVFLPLYLFGWEALFVTVLFWGVLGTILFTGFEIAHNSEKPIHVALESSGCRLDWHKHQIETTANFSMDSAFATWFYSGLNYQIEHHLFPYADYIHYPELSKKLKNVLKDYDVPYHSYETLGDGIKSVFKNYFNLSEENTKIYREDI